MSYGFEPVGSVIEQHPEESTEERLKNGFTLSAKYFLPYAISSGHDRYPKANRRVYQCNIDDGAICFILRKKGEKEMKNFLAFIGVVALIAVVYPICKYGVRGQVAEYVKGII